MPELLQPEPRLAGAAVSKRQMTEADISKTTLTKDEEVTLFSTQVPEDKVYWWGHGPQNRQQASGFWFAQLKASGSGTNTDGTTVTNCDLILAITDADQRRVLASTIIGTGGEGNDAQGESNSDRPILAALAPYAKPGRYLEFRVRAKDSTAGGSEIDSDSDIRIPYGEAYVGGQ